MALKSHEMDLFGAPAGEDLRGLRWPDAARFPLNVGSRRVEEQVWQDLLESPEPLIVAGYSSLDRIIDFIARAGRASAIRLLFGQEPFDARRAEFRLTGDAFATEVEAYWLRQGISLLRSAAVIRAIEALESGRVEARYMADRKGLHAKIYCGQKAATVGSSNFTEPGLSRQLEANARFERGSEGKRYGELVGIAENYWTMGVDFRVALIALLKKLLRPVTWEEALARACAELLEGEWAEAYLRENYLGEAGSLWPSQKQGIAQALAILSERGSVLVADATGAGKTRMGAYLVGAVVDHIVRTGRLRQGRALMICPPAVLPDWKREAMQAHIHLETFSHGGLSHGKSRGHELSVESLRRAQVLCVDEGHNFLNLASNRSQQLLRNMADHVVLLTATPINRGVNDLLRIADMLGADNLADSTLKAFQRMLGARNLTRSLSEVEVDQLRKEIRQFTVRRTKRVLNSLIDREPEAYRDRRGRPCRFPRHKPKVYRLKEPDTDRTIAVNIRALADELYGVTHFVRPIEMPEVLRRQGVSEERYLQGRLGSARKLAGYQIMSALRSSRAALLEHLRGSEAAIEAFGIEGFSKKAETGNLIASIRGLEGRVPPNKLSIELPTWLREPEAHAEACAHDLDLYQRIAALVPRLSAQREQAKVDLLIKLVARHGLVLAFDSRPISLALIRHMIGVRPRVECLLAWGDAASDRETVLKSFAPGSTARGVIGLCSDSLSEGVNLQQASVLVHLDMPSVVRIAEQRVGRVDRMDSPHREIEAWWPEDAPEFALSSDHRFIERFETVERLLGSNMPLPEHLQFESAAPVRTEDMIESFEQAAEDSWDGIEDAFQPVRSLVEGPEALVGSDIYARYRDIDERVIARVSLVRAPKPWAFFCLNAGPFNAPRWVFVPEDGTPKFELSEVATALRENLGDDVEDLSFDEHGTSTLQRFLLRLPKIERGLLSKKKQRALAEMAICIERLTDHAKEQGDQALVDHLYEIQKVLTSDHLDGQPDWDEIASRWLDVIRPVWFEKLAGKRNKPLLLKDIRKDLLARPERLARMVTAHFRVLPAVVPADQRVRACVVGVPN
jgi:hypothetical protein